MTTDIQLLRSAVERKRPDPSLLLDGQAAINTNASEPGLFFRLSDGNLTKIGPAHYNTNGNAPNSNPAGSAGNATGETWLDGRAEYAAPILKVFNGSIWVASNGFTVDDTNGNLSIARRVTVTSLVGTGTGNESFIRFPQDTTSARPATPEMGMWRFNTTDNVFEGYDGTNWVRYLVTGGGGGGGDITINDITVNGDANLGSNCGASTVTINGVTQVNCNATFGATSGNTVTFVSRIGSNFEPDNASRTIGSSTLRWAEGWFSTVNASGNSTLGSGCTTTTTINSALVANCNSTLGATAANTIRANGRFVSGLIPQATDTYDLGSAALRWNNLYANNINIGGDFTVGTSCQDTFTVNSRLAVNCSATLGQSGSQGQTLTVNSNIASNLVPDANNRTLGTAQLPWSAATITSATVTTSLSVGNGCGSGSMTLNGVLTQNCQSNFIASTYLWNAQDLRFSPTAAPAMGANYVGFKSPASLTANQIWALPTADGMQDQVLKTDGNGNLGWRDVTGGDSNLTVTGNLTVEGNTTLGNSCVDDTLTVQAVATFNCNTTLGGSAAVTTTVGSLLNVNEGITVTAQKNLKFTTGAFDSNGIGFKAPSTNIAADVIWALPNADGGNGTVLTTNGQGDLSWQAVGSNTQPVTVGDNAPTANLTNGQLWWNSAETANNGSNRLYVYYVDANGGQWVDASPAGAGATNFIFNADIVPTQDNAYDIGSTTNRVANLYANEMFTGDLHMKNERGDWTLIEEEDFLSIRCNKTGKRFKFLMEQLDD